MVHKKPFTPVDSGATTLSRGRDYNRGRDDAIRKCWTCGKPGHYSKDCREAKKESPGRPDKKPLFTNMVQSNVLPAPVEAEDNPFHFLYSSDSENSEEVKQVRVSDQGSKPHRAKVVVQGVPMFGVVDTGADITILGGEMFKRVAAFAKLVQFTSCLMAPSMMPLSRS